MKNKQPMIGLPSSPQAEQAVIGTILATPSCVQDSIQLNPEYFFDPKNRMVVQAISALIAEQKPPEPTLVFNKLRDLGNEINIGGFESIRLYLEYNSKPEFISHWLEEVKSFWKLRTIAEMCHNFATEAKSVRRENIAEFLSEAENKFIELSTEMKTKGLETFSSIVIETMNDLNDAVQNEGKLTGIPSGFKDLDKITSGFQPSDLIILAARPAMGKTSFALNIATHAAIDLGKVVALFSLEMSSKQLSQRILGSESKIESNKFRGAKIGSEEFSRLYPNVSKFINIHNLFIDDTGSLSLLEMTSRCRRLKREQGKLDMIIVDYLQLMTTGQPKIAQNREREISIISMGLKSLAKELDCPVIALSQLNRNLEQRPDKRPRSSDLRESGSLEQDADIVMFVYRDEVYNKDSPDKGIAELIIGKNRHGAIDTIKLAFDITFTKFNNLARL